MTITQYRARLNACARRKIRKCRIKVVVLCCITRLTCVDSAVDGPLSLSLGIVVTSLSLSPDTSWRRTHYTTNAEWWVGLDQLAQCARAEVERESIPANWPTTSRVLCVRGGKSWRGWGRPVAVSCQITIQLLFIGIIKVTCTHISIHTYCFFSLKKSNI